MENKINVPRVDFYNSVNAEKAGRISVMEGILNGVEKTPRLLTQAEIDIFRAHLSEAMSLLRMKDRDDVPGM
jgi:hypothetical protein